MNQPSPSSPADLGVDALSRSKNILSDKRKAIAIVLILLALGQIVGKILSINSINTLALEQTARTDLNEELKHLYVTAKEAGLHDEQTLYAKTLKEEFQFDVALLDSNPSATEAAKKIKERSPRRWPVESRRQNWESRRKELSPDALIAKVISETKYRRSDLLQELKLSAALAFESGDDSTAQIYVDAIPKVLNLIAQETEPPAKAPDFDPSELRDPSVVAELKKSKADRTHHWPIELRKKDQEWMVANFSEESLIKTAVLESKRQRPFLSGNDRSRWLTVRSLVELGTFEINDIVEYEPLWDSVDVVSHMNSQGEQKLYSSKPPLHAVLVAAPYWLIQKTTGCTLESHPFEVGRALLILFNVIPLGIGWWWCTKLINEWTESDAVFAVSLGSIVFATMLSTFAVALNNHLWGAVAAIGTMWYATRCWQGSFRWQDFVGAGFWAAATFTCELPGASLLAIVGLLVLVNSPRRTLVFSAPAVVAVVVLYFSVNYVAHGVWKPPYSYGAGDVNTEQSKQVNNWYDYDFIRKFDGRKVDSYWRNPNNPLDLGEASTPHYLFHSLIGHHGLFSLTPILIFGFAGMLVMLFHKQNDQRNFAIAITLTSLACLAFYLFFLDVRQRNYGGTTVAFRQLLWLHPIWLIASLPVLERILVSRFGRWLFALCALVSMVSVSYPTWNPWSQNWIWNLMIWWNLNPLSS